MIHLRQSANINLYDLYRILKSEYPGVVKAHMYLFKDLPSMPRTLDCWIDKIKEYIDSRIEPKKLNVVNEKIKNNKHPLIEYYRKEYILSEQGLEIVGKERAMSYILSKKYISPTIENKMMSTRFYETMKDIATSNMMSSVLTSMFYTSIEGKYDKNFTIKKDGKITYLPANKKCIITENGNWDTSPRQEIKYGKAVKKLFNGWYDISNVEVEKINNELASKYTFQAKLKVVSGKEITHYYHHSTYGENTGSLESSCMKHSSCQGYFEIYENNCEMLIALDEDDKVIGRALLWNEVINTDNGENIKFMDRIYGTDITIEAFKGWARQNGYYHKKEQSYSNTTGIVCPDGYQSNNILEINIKGGEYEELPYFDTFKYCDNPEQDEFTINNDQGDYEMTSTEGENPGYSEMVRLHDGTRVHQDDANYIESEGQYYHIDESTYVDSRGDCYLNEDVVEDVDGEYIHIDDSIYIESTCEYYYRGDNRIVYCDETGEHELVSDIIEASDGNIYLQESVVQCSITEEYIHKDNAIEKNGMYFSDELDESEIEKFLKDENQRN